MQGIVITHRPKIGDLPNDLRLTAVAKPEPRKSEILIKVLFATITIDDINIAEGTEMGGIPIGPSPSSKKPVILGIELSGLVEKTGTNVTKFKAGDSVFESVGFPIKRGGAWAEYCCVKANSIKPVIDKIIDFNEKDIREAINYVRTHRATGKVVIKINHT